MDKFLQGLIWFIVIVLAVDDLKPGGIFPDKMCCDLHVGETGKHFQEANPLIMFTLGPLIMNGVNVKEMLSENVCWHNSVLPGLLKGDPIPPKSLFGSRRGGTHSV